MAETELERIYTIPLRAVKSTSRNGRADRAVREVRAFLIRHMKSDDIWIDDAVNRAIWARGKFTVPSRLRVRAVKFDDGVVEVSLPEEEAMSSIRQQLKDERESKAPILPAPGAEDDEETETEIGEIEAEPEDSEDSEEPEETEGSEAPEAEESTGKPEPEGAKPAEKPSAAAEEKAPKATRKADAESAATPADSGAEQHEHAKEPKKRDVDKAEEDHA